MDAILLVIVAVVLAWLGIRLVYLSRAETRARMVHDYSHQVGLAVTPEIEPELSSRIYRRERAGVIGSMAGLIVGVVFMFMTNGTESPWNGLLAVLAATVGSSVALILNASRSAFTPVPEEPRLARSKSPVLADYVTSLDRIFSLGLLGLATFAYIGVLGVIALNPERVFDSVSVRSILWPSGLLLALATAASLITWSAAGGLLGRGQPANTFIELAWSDALRSTTLRSLVSIPGILAAVSTGVLFLSLSEAINLPAPGSVGEILVGSFTIMGPVLLVTLIGWSATGLRHRSTTHYLRRLWPETATELGRRRGPTGPTLHDRPDSDSRTKTSA